MCVCVCVFDNKSVCLEAEANQSGRAIACCLDIQVDVRASLSLAESIPMRFFDDAIQDLIKEPYQPCLRLVNQLFNLPAYSNPS